MSETKETADSRRQTAGTLLPCPFCGSEPEMMDEEVYFGIEMHCVACGVCGVETRFHPTEAEALAAWNRRAAPVAKWTKEPTEAGIYLKQDVFETGSGQVKCDPVIQEVSLGGDGKLYAVNGIHRCEVKKICSQYRWWFKLNVPALPEEGGSE